MKTQEINNDEIKFEHSNRVRERIALVIFIIVLVAACFVVSLYFGTAKIFNVVATKVDEQAGTMDFCSSIIYSGVLNDDSAESKVTLKAAETKVYTSDVRSEYIDKRASVITVDMAELAEIEKPLILDVGEKQVGVFSIKSYMTKSQVKLTVDSLKEGGANVVICIAPRSNMLGSFDGVDAVLCTKERSPNEAQGDHIENAFIFRCAEVDTVGVLSISSSNAFIQRVYDR